MGLHIFQMHVWQFEVSAKIENPEENSAQKRYVIFRPSLYGLTKVSFQKHFSKFLFVLKIRNFDGKAALAKFEQKALEFYRHPKSNRIAHILIRSLECFRTERFSRSNYTKQ